MNWRPQDTLFWRLFGLLWLALVLSHWLAFSIVTEWVIPFTRPPSQASAPSLRDQPVIFPSLPPQTTVMTPANGPSVTVPGLPWYLLLLDYGLRVVVMGLASWWGARWLSQPWQRLSAASDRLGRSLAQNTDPPQLDETSGTTEVRETAKIFNRLAHDLQREFQSRELLFATVSHDLRTPLTRIRLRLESMPPSPELQRCIADTREMDTLIQGALSLLRPDSHTTDLHITDVAALAEAAVDDWVEQAAPVVWRSPEATTPRHAWTDPAALRRVLDNVIQNALQHARNVQVSAATHEATGGLQLVVDDDGPGIPPTALERIAGANQPLHRSDELRSHPGHGLGLYIAKDLMTRQQGRLTLRNRPEGGLQVTLELNTQTVR